MLEKEAQAGKDPGEGGRERGWVSIYMYVKRNFKEKKTAATRRREDRIEHNPLCVSLSVQLSSK